MEKYLVNLKINFIVKATLENLIIFFAIFPWVSFGLNQLDSQPWILFTLIIYYFYIQKVENLYLFYFWIITILFLTFTKAEII